MYIVKNELYLNYLIQILLFVFSIILLIIIIKLQKEKHRQSLIVKSLKEDKIKLMSILHKHNQMGFKIKG